MEDDVELTGYMCAWADEKEHVDIVKERKLSFEDQLWNGSR